MRVFNSPKDYFRKKDNIRVLALLMPGLIVVAMFTFYPIIKMFVMSFFDWKIGYNQVSAFVGFENYRDVFSDPQAGIAISNTLYYALITVPFQMVIGLFVALLINGIKKFSVTSPAFVLSPCNNIMGRCSPAVQIYIQATRGCSITLSRTSSK